MSDKEFVNGLLVKPPREGAPDFVKGSLSIRRDEMINFLAQKKEDWINIDIKASKEGKWYAEVNNWKPQQSAPPQENKQKDEFSDEIPFS